MRYLENNYVKAVMLLVLILIAVSFTNVKDVIVKSTARVIETKVTDRLLFECSFEESLNCNGKNPSKKQGVGFVEGKVGKGVFIEGTDVLEYPTEDNFDSDKGTIEFWVKPNWDSSSVGAHRFFYTNYDGWDFWIGSEYFNYHLYFCVKSVNIPYSIYDWKADTWHYIAVTWDRLETKLYIDGVYKAKDDYYTPAGRPEKIYIGSENTQTNQAEAVIDELKIYNYVRTPKQIKNDFESYREEEKPAEPEEPAEIPTEPTTEEPEAEEPEITPEPEPSPEPAPPIEQTIFLWAFIGFLLIVVVYLLVQLNKRK